MTKPLTHEEQEELLCRRVEPLLTVADREAFAARRVLITGAGGSVGSELTRQVAVCRPSRVTLVDHCEHALFRIEQEIRERWPSVGLDVVLADVTRGPTIRQAIRRARPQAVFHAAAYKHVPMAERAICASARVNVLGTCAVMAGAREIGASFILISSDKAAAPRGVMGATKRLAELAAVAEADGKFQPVVLRFGNILASSGSFVEVMWERICQGRPLILTDPDATRYFMTVTEAASLVMKAATIACGGETFWLDMGEQVRIGDLAQRLLQVAARRGWPPVPVDVVGLRPGEKLVEQLTSQGLEMQQTAHPRIWVARQPAPERARWETALFELRESLRRDDALGALRALVAGVADFEPSAQAWATARAERMYVRTRTTRARRSA